MILETEMTVTVPAQLADLLSELNSLFGNEVDDFLAVCLAIAEGKNYADGFHTINIKLERE